ncbi:MAG TPA: ABC transporter permease, partial [Clostridiaceae bacterium]|nr:ABC transporter permease [Clostridiaceae bacterium]
SVTILVGMGEGTQKQISDQIENLGTNLITVSITGNRTTTITDEDLNELKAKPGIKEIAPEISTGNVNIKSKSKSSTTTLEASTPEYAEIRKLAVQSGRFIKRMDVDNRFNVLVIGPETAQNIFGNTNVVGNTMYVNGIEFTVVGVLKSEGTSTTGSSDDRIIIPLSTGERLMKTAKAQTFYVEAESKDKVDEAMSYLELFLNKKFKIRNSGSDSTVTNSYYRVMSQTSILDTANSTTKSMTSMLAGIAAISLIVGGIGIMNIMLVSVAERTREIGIRKAIGAKKRNILMQFLIESAGISGFGGIMGVLLGYIGAYFGEHVFGTAIIIPSNIVIEAFVFSMVVGIIFGIYPANKASNLNPIDALRFE